MLRTARNEDPLRAQVEVTAREVPRNDRALVGTPSLGRVAQERVEVAGRRQLRVPGHDGQDSGMMADSIPE